LKHINIEHPDSLTYVTTKPLRAKHMLADVTVLLQVMTTAAGMVQINQVGIRSSAANVNTFSC